MKYEDRPLYQCTHNKTCWLGDVCRASHFENDEEPKCYMPCQKRPDAPKIEQHKTEQVAIVWDTSGQGSLF